MASAPGQHQIRVAILCALSVESQAVEKLFDTIYETKTLLWQRAEGDRNAYATGRIGRHNVVLAYMPGIGKVNATTTANGLNATFPNIELALVVGICGGSPRNPLGQHADDSRNEQVYLGDVVISTDIQQSDFGRENVNGFVVRAMHEGNLPLRSMGISALLHKLQSTEFFKSLKQRTATRIGPLLRSLQLSAPGKEEDILYQADYFHKHRSSLLCSVCPSSETSICEESLKLSCTELQCGRAFQSRSRRRDTTDGPEIFLGRVSSSDAVKRNGLTRDHAITSQNIIAFEMEGAGVSAILPTLVIKGVCDYADSHKNKIWQPYAAATAAACTKELLEEWPSYSVASEATTLNKQDNIVSENRMKCLASLDFPQLDHRLKNISLPYLHTCEWMSKTTEFGTWLDNGQSAAHNRILWIKGRPGCGKSTMMKYLHHTISKHLPKYTVLSFFFNARGTELERTPIGMLRSILHQLLSSRQDLLDMLTKELSRQTHSNMNIHSWSFEELENFCQLCAKEGRLDNIAVFIDALDECESGEAYKIANFCEDLSVNSMDQKTSCFICISIRHFPNIGMKKCIKLNLDEKAEHREDIKSYIVDKLHADDEQELVDQILRKSNHVFLWAVLVVQELNSAYDDGAQGEMLKDLLSSIPDKLYSIYEKLLSTEQRASPETRLALQIVLHSFRPITLRELHFLTLVGTNSKTQQSVVSGSTSVSTLDRYLVSKSSGLLEAVRLSKIPLDGTEQVQFIHETIRAFLLNDDTPSGKMLADDQASHEAIARACLQSMSTITQRVDAGDALWNLHLEDESKEVYMLRWVLHHIGEISDIDRTIELLRLYSQVFRIRFRHKWILGDSKEEDGLICAIIQCYTYGRSIGIGQEQLGRLARLLRVTLANGIGITADTSQSMRGKHEHALKEAIDAGWLEGVEALINAGADLTGHSHGNQTVLHWSLICAFHGGIDTSWDLILGRIIQELKETGYDFNDSSIPNSLPLPYTCRLGQPKFVTMLLEAGASLTAVDPVLGSPLDIAVVVDRPGIAKILLDYGADPLVSQTLGCGPLEWAEQKDAWHMSTLLKRYVADSATSSRG